MLAAIVSLATLSQLPSIAAAESEIGLAEAIGVPQGIAEWVRSDELPGPADLLVTLEE